MCTRPPGPFARARPRCCRASSWPTCDRLPFRWATGCSEGQLLVTLDSQDLDTKVRRAEAAEAEVVSAIPEADNGVAGAKANLDLAQSTFKRMEELASKKSISNQEFDESSARLKSAQAAYEMARSKRAQLDSKRAQVRAGNPRRQYHARLCADLGAVFRGGDGEIRGAGKPGRSRRSPSHHGAGRRLSAGGIRGRIPASVREDRADRRGRPGIVGPPVSRAGVGNRAGGGCGLARLHREDRSACGAESAVGHVRTRAVPTWALAMS